MTVLCIILAALSIWDYPSRHLEHSRLRSQFVQATRTGDTAKMQAVCRKGGVIIMVSGCSDGHGGESFYKALKAASSPEEILERVKTVPRDATTPDQWQYQIMARVLKRFKVIMYAPECDSGMLREMMVEVAASPADALARAFEYCGGDAKVAALPDGVSVIPVRK